MSATDNSQLASLHAERIRRTAAATAASNGRELCFGSPGTSAAAATRIRVQEIAGQHLGSVVWDGALALCRFLSTLQPSHPLLPRDVYIQGATVLELGAGVGAPGILLAALGAGHVVLTERDDAALQCLRLSVSANVPKVAACCTVVGLDWGWDAAKIQDLARRHRCGVPLRGNDTAGPALRLVVAADCVYSPETATTFVHALGAVMEYPNDTRAGGTITTDTTPTATRTDAAAHVHVQGQEVAGVQHGTVDSHVALPWQPVATANKSATKMPAREAHVPRRAVIAYTHRSAEADAALSQALAAAGLGVLGRIPVPPARDGAKPGARGNAADGGWQQHQILVIGRQEEMQ